MRKLEESLIRLLAIYKIDGERVQGLTGVWTRNGKIAAMGVHISRWVTRHGFALNVNTDLSYYDLIVPCGIIGKSVTSMQMRLMRTVDMQEVADRYAVEFGSTFGRRMTWMKVCEFRDELRRLPGATGAVGKGTSPGAPGV
jgi:lipoate-protein ligase B